MVCDLSGAMKITNDPELVSYCLVRFSSCSMAGILLVRFILGDICFILSIISFMSVTNYFDLVL